jgi:hypothetical protein
MNTREDKNWQNLLLRSTPTFAGVAEPPYGFVTGVLAQLRAEKHQLAEIERIGWRALVASLVTLGAVVVFTAGLQLQDRYEPDPSVKNMIEMDNVSVS